MILVTGATGFIGSQLCRVLSQRGLQEIVAVDLVPPNERPQQLEGIPFVRFLARRDLGSFLESPEARFLKAVFHMGANSSTTETDWALLEDLNIGDSRKLFEWCAKNQVPLVYASSAATYGDGAKGFDDRTPASQLKAMNLYGRSKVEFDAWVEEQVRQQRPVPPHWYGLKFFNVYGPGESHKGSQASVVFHAFHQIQTTGRLKLFKSYRREFLDGEQKRDFVYVKDLCYWMLDLLEKKPASGIYNMGTGEARTWKDLARAVFAALSKTENIEFIDMPENLRNQYQYFTEARMEKWLQEGMSRPQFSLEKGVADYVQGYLLRQEKR